MTSCVTGVARPAQVRRAARRVGRPAQPTRPSRPGVGAIRGPVGGAVACRVTRPARTLWMRVKLTVFSLLTALSFAVAAPHLLGMTQPDPATDPVAGDPAWAHVLGP